MLKKLSLLIVMSLITLPALAKRQIDTTMNCSNKVYLLAMNANTNGLKKTNLDRQRITNTFQKLYGKRLIMTALNNVKVEDYAKHIKTIKIKVKSNDCFILYFSGHATVVTDLNGDEGDDGLDEALMAFTRKKVHTFNELILDDTLSKDLNEINTKHLIVILDTCLSGGMSKEISFSKVNKVSKFSFVPSLIKSLTKRQQFYASHNDPQSLIDHGKGVLISASDEAENAWEYQNGKIQGGIFTYYFTKALLKHKGNYAKAFSDAQFKVQHKSNKEQNPRWSFYQNRKKN